MTDLCKAEPNPARVAEKLRCYRLKTHPELCTAQDCEYNNRDPVIGYYCCYNRLLHDAEELLEKMAKTKVVFSQNDGSVETVCGNCGYGLDKTYSRCPKCGKELDWNETY